MKNRRLFVKAAAATLLVAASFHMQGCGRKQDINGIETTVSGKGEENKGSEGVSTEAEADKNIPEDGEKESSRTENNGISREEKERWKDRMEESGEETEIEDIEPLDGPKVIIGTDIHYLSSEYTDYGEAFQNMVNYGDGRSSPILNRLQRSF